MSYKYRKKKRLSRLPGQNHEVRDRKNALRNFDRKPGADRRTRRGQENSDAKAKHYAPSGRMRTRRKAVRPIAEKECTPDHLRIVPGGCTRRFTLKSAASDRMNRREIGGGGRQRIGEKPEKKRQRIGGKPTENRRIIGRKIDGNPAKTRGKSEKTSGKSTENRWETVEKSTANRRKTGGQLEEKPAENRRKTGEKNDGESAENWREKRQRIGGKPTEIGGELEGNRRKTGGAAGLLAQANSTSGTDRIRVFCVFKGVLGPKMTKWDNSGTRWHSLPAHYPYFCFRKVWE